MEITKNDVGKKVYFIDRRINETFVVEYGEVTGVVPKYNFQDRFAQTYSRNENILILTKVIGGEKSKVINNVSLIFKTMGEVLDYCRGTDVTFGYSVVAREGNLV